MSTRFLVGASIAVAATASVFLSSCGASPNPEGEHWKQVSQVDGGFIRFVEVKREYAKDRRVYDEAIRKICPAEDCWQVGFFVEGDSTPPNSSRRAFFQGGAWAPYTPVAVYNGSDAEFKTWNCDRAGADGAPLSALCGPGALEEYRAVLALAGWSGWRVACGYSPTNEEPLFREFVATKATQKREQLIAAWDEHRADTRGPDLLSACETLRPRLEENAADARVALRDGIAMASKALP